MSTGYGMHLAVTAGCAALALFPPRRPPFLTRAANVLTPAVNEVPQLFGLVLVASTVLAVLEGDLRQGAGAPWLLAAGALALAALAVLAVRGIRARAAVGRGLDAAGIADAGATGQLWRWALRVAVAPVPLRPREVERISDIAYGPDRRQRLDVYRRRDRPQGGPVLLYLHGGGYFSGDKHREARALLHRLAARGWLCVSATYRLRPAAGFEEHLEDAEAALAWSHRHTAEYGADPSTLVMAGSSAGAHLTALVALRPPSAVGADQAPRVKAAVGLYGYYGRYYGRGPDEASPSTPMALDARDAPPFYLVHGDLDVQVSVTGARGLAAKLREESSSPVVLVELPAGQHGFDLWQSWRTTAVLDGLERFLADSRVLGKRAGAR